MKLEILGVGVHVATPDAHWEGFLRRLWEPLIVEGARTELRFEVAARGQGWVLRTEERDLGMSTNPWLIADGLRNVLFEMAVPLATHVVTLHAAALVHGGTVLLVAGASGTGKTTLSLALVERGWRLLSDDAAPIDRLTGEVVPVPKPVGIKAPELWVAMGGSGEGWPGPPSGAFLVPAPAPHLEPASPTHLVFATFDPGSEDRSEELTTAQAVALLGPLVRTVEPATVSELTRVAGAVRAIRAGYGSTAGALDLLTRWFHPATG